MENFPRGEIEVSNREHGEHHGWILPAAFQGTNIDLSSKSFALDRAPRTRLLFDFREGKTQWDMFPSFEPIVTSPHGSLTRQTFDKTTDGYRVMPEVAGSYPRRCPALLYRADGIIPEDLHKRNVYVNIIVPSNWYLSTDISSKAHPLNS